MGRGGCRFAHVVRQPRCPGGASPAQANGLCDCGCGCRNLAGERRAGQRWRVHRRTREGCAQLWSARAPLAAAAMSAADAVMARVMRWPRPYRAVISARRSVTVTALAVGAGGHVATVSASACGGLRARRSEPAARPTSATARPGRRSGAFIYQTARLQDAPARTGRPCQTRRSAASDG